jgi:hypothetical protein
MVKIYLWFPGKPGGTKWFHAVTGHIAIQIGKDYCSFWPCQDKKDGTKENIGMITPSPADFSKVSYSADILGMEYPADDSVDIAGLDEQSMLREWNKLKKQKTLYALNGANCCTITARLLDVGFINTKAGRNFMRRSEASSLKSAINSSLIYSQTTTPSVVLFLAYMIKNEVEGLGQAEDEIMNIVRQKHPNKLVQIIRNFLGF